MDKIVTHKIETKAGHDLDVFYNKTTGLLVISLNHATRSGGNEIMRRTLNERALLKHCAKLPTWTELDAQE